MSENNNTKEIIEDKLKILRETIKDYEEELANVILIKERKLKLIKQFTLIPMSVNLLISFINLMSTGFSLDLVDLLIAVVPTGILYTVYKRSTNSNVKEKELNIDINKKIIKKLNKERIKLKKELLKNIEYEKKNEANLNSESNIHSEDILFDYMLDLTNEITIYENELNTKVNSKKKVRKLY